jgi:hypothetical protein
VRKIVLATIVGGLFAGLLAPRTASAQTSFFAVKFVCGLQRPNAGLTPPSEPPVKPGNYATKINVELLSPDASSGAPLAVSFIVSRAGASPTSPAAQLVFTSQYQTIDITCADIVKQLPPTVAIPSFINGYVNIAQLPGATLAVTGVYTSEGYAFPQIGGRSLPPVPGAQVDIDVVPQTTIKLPPS